MKTIWKYPLNVCDVQTIYPPKGSTLLSVQIQFGKPFIWALVDSLTIDVDEYTVYMFETGNPIEKDFAWNTQFLGTIQQYDGELLVWHVFYEEA